MEEDAKNKKLESNREGGDGGKKKPVRIWVDGCFDIMHYGHANALRQAKNCGDYLIVGVHSDEEIKKNKGPTVMNSAERYAAVRACKWVDEVVEDAPYVTQLEMVIKYDVDYVVHGDDTTLAADGTDCYAQVKAAGKFKEVPRTTGVSTTDIVRRMLECTKEHHEKGSGESSPMLMPMREGHDRHSPYTGVSKFIATGAKIRLFSDGREPKPTDKIVYIDGGWDLFHEGHVNILKKAKALGDFLIVGVLEDAAVNSYKGVNFPLMNVYERVLSVLSCRYCDEVVIGAPLKLEKDFIQGMRIQIVAGGTVSCIYPDDMGDPHAVPKEMGIYQEIESGSNLTTTVILERIRENRELYVSRNKAKEKKEIEFIHKAT
eukprot:TRINITY_DN6060_c0_g1_i1.p1 TRINITY_DN6060_c0_g1~~TRINITY_DN6060_c0_g1_i1.p1  ORF type:complete len:374 (-),score=88.27 TRINITY_DN6060_c0_g1_i1:106-1227(-)